MTIGVFFYCIPSFFFRLVGFSESAQMLHTINKLKDKLFFFKCLHILCFLNKQTRMKLCITAKNVRNIIRTFGYVIEDIRTRKYMKRLFYL